MGTAVSALDTHFMFTSKADIFDMITTQLADVATQIGTIQTSVAMLVGLKVTESQLNAALDGAAVTMLQTDVTGTASLMVQLSSTFDKMSKKTKTMVTFAKIAS